MGHAHYQPAIDACRACAEACERCVSEGRKEESARLNRSMALALDCAAFCRLAAEFMTRNSEFVDLVCEDCAEICQACATECQEHNLEHCHDCVAACRACAEACLTVSLPQ